MELQALLTRISDSKKSGKDVVTGTLKVFPPNGKEKLSIRDTKELKWVEDTDAVIKSHPLGRGVTNYYYIRRIDQSAWKYLGKSSDWLDMFQISTSIDVLDGPGVYFIKGIAYDENDNSIYVSSDTCKFEIE
ncbi:MAG: hypothetical protein ACXVK3_10230 [Candidatus Angelobacter sp.]